MQRDFNKWFSTFKKDLTTFNFYTNFDKIYHNVDNIRLELSLLNSLIGASNIEDDFDNLIRNYPEVLKCIPILLAVRATELNIAYENRLYSFNFMESKNQLCEYKLFMRETGLFDLLKNHLISNIIDYVTGVETGLDSNGRKNRRGHLMEDLVERYIQDAGFVRNVSYYKEIKISRLTSLFNIDLSCISNNGKTEKRFDFVIKTDNKIYLIETNYYESGGSKLNETARSYKQIATDVKKMTELQFVWITDGAGWKSARHNLEETFDAMEHLYNISDLESGIIKRIIL
ncbi:MAG: type II restriction endonuclease [Firmicutes bacterium]|nr:type II restriction endonuclease [Ezakiella sp.]MDD7761432.1 type II restriction endonuclease [Bacillota bacterium]